MRIMDEYEDIVLLEEFADALVGCVYDPEGTPIPCYVAEKVWEKLAGEGFSGEEADDYIDQLTDGLRVVWIHPLDLRPDFEPDKKPHLRLVH
jgi:hypothetical protein